MLSRFPHERLVTLIGYSRSPLGEMCLVFEAMRERTLEILRQESSFDAHSRVVAVFELLEAVRFLHELSFYVYAISLISYVPLSLFACTSVYLCLAT